MSADRIREGDTYDDDGFPRAYRPDDELRDSQGAIVAYGIDGEGWTLEEILAREG